LGEHIDQEDVKAKSKFMSGIAGGRPLADGPAPITAITVGVELVSQLLIENDLEGNLIIQSLLTSRFPMNCKYVV
jgi:hypothetical protein